MNEIDNFRSIYGRGRPYLNRMSTLIWVDIFAMNATYGIDPFKILMEIDGLEGLASGSRTKKPSQFKFPPLKGLWHKHFFDSRFIAKNITSALGEKRLKDIVDIWIKENKDKTITQEIVAKLAHEVTHGVFDRRSAEGRLTGEWIIYAENEGRNFYLTCKPHSSDDRIIFEEISYHCAQDFPDLLTWIRDAERRLSR
ncbi:hypothetical protein [Ancylobacter lacus]|uniref:hypothetical protein n=1 Tax=Ancylobacter lacus TaxID=2579970 RepID=UPI001BCAB372|nr:hypothetical protein [Ancylobacter lacus]MBS7540386.1 hypothetical protein [Ancylobacter lacus]